MTIALVHYHLGPGGVSHVIAAASRALTAAGVRHVILVGEISGDFPDGLPVRLVHGLGYGFFHKELSGVLLLKSLYAEAHDALGSPPNVWHFHNHSLGKNGILADAVSCLAMQNARIILQIHDLAEDGRPENYFSIDAPQKLYPVSKKIHYAFLNTRDREIFMSAGLGENQSSVLENPIELQASDQQASGPPILFAPVRGIRRKNLGELVLLAALAPAGTRVAVSRAPHRPQAIPVHDCWEKFATTHGFPIGFGVVDRYAPQEGAASDFESWIAHASHFVSCSVAEGFGLPFLEAIACGKPLIGRNLPHITAEHARHGIRAGDLYERILVPSEWIDLTILRDYLRITLERNYRSYRRHLSQEIFTATFEGLLHDGWLDFGNLPEPLQQGVIERLTQKANRNIPQVQRGEQLLCAVDWLAAAVACRTPKAGPEQLAPYEVSAYQQKIFALYSSLAGISDPACPVRFLPASEILTAFLHPHAFHFLLSALKPQAAALKNYRTVIFDIYGTLLIAPAGGVKPDPAADPLLRQIIQDFGYSPPDSPSSALHAAVRTHHAQAETPHPEVDLRVLWREVLFLPEGTDTTPLVAAIEHAWHPATLMPGAEEWIRRLARMGVSLGLLSNAQSNTLESLGELSQFFAPELVILSYQYGIAKPSPKLFQMLADRLSGRGIAPSEVLYIGNDPLHDILPAAAHGFKTALFTGHPDSLRQGNCSPDFLIRGWPDGIHSDPILTPC